MIWTQLFREINLLFVSIGIGVSRFASFLNHLPVISNFYYLTSESRIVNVATQPIRSSRGQASHGTRHPLTRKCTKPNLVQARPKRSRRSHSKFPSLDESTPPLRRHLQPALPPRRSQSWPPSTRLPSTRRRGRAPPSWRTRLPALSSTSRATHRT